MKNLFNKKQKLPDCPPDFTAIDIEIYNAVTPYTMTTPERVFSLVNAIQYLEKNQITGAMVECGVWKGGSSMAMALTLKKLGSENRDIYLYDTFAGMPAPKDVDVSIKGNPAHKKFSKRKTSEDSSNWCFAPFEEVKKNVLGTGYNKDKIHFIKGKVEDSIPKTLPKEIALLRLDTDWYESTKHELIHMFPLLKTNGVLIVDDYGHWKGAKIATDEYIEENNIQILLNRIDYTGRIAIKTC
jgi:O-methyltransferase